MGQTVQEHDGGTSGRACDQGTTPRGVDEAGTDRRPVGSAFVERYLGLVCDDATPGGCFFTAAGIEFEHRPGRIHDRLDEIRSSWFELAAGELRAARAAGEIDEAADIDQLAFETIILLQGTNLAFQMSHDPAALERGRRAIADRLARDAS